MAMSKLEKYYNKFKEENRLGTRHGQVEFNTTMKYIHDFIPEGQKVRILDVGAGTGRYSVALAREGHDVTAVELVKHNLEILESKHEHVNCWPGNAMDLSFLPDAGFDITLMFGPMYHLLKEEERLKAFSEARRVTKKGGLIFVAYVMNEYSVVSYCFKEHHAKECVDRASLTQDFHQIITDKDLYVYLRIEDIDRMNKASGLNRIKIFAADGPSDYMRPVLNQMDDDEFEIYKNYILSIAERPELLGASSHTVDILQN